MRRFLTALLLLSVLSFFAPQAVFAQATEDETTIQAPILNVTIPTVSFAKVVEEGGKFEINFMADYLSGLYRFLLGFGSMVAIVMIMIGGVQYVLAAGSGNVAAAKTRIMNAITGLVLLMFAFLIVYTINPQLTLFEPVRVEIISQVLMDDVSSLGEEEIDSNVSIPDGSSVPQHPSLSSRGNILNNVLLPDLYAAMDEFHNATGQTAILTSGFRTGAKQMQLFWDQCLKNPSGVCSPTTGSGGIGSEVVKKNSAGGYDRVGKYASMSREEFIAAAAPLVKASAGAHLSSVGLDIWCAKGLQGDFTFDTACQLKLTEAMLNHNFCRLTIEVWHFEYAPLKVSPTCQSKGSLVPYMQFTKGQNVDFSRFSTWDADADNPERNVACKSYDEANHICLDNM